MCAQTHGHMCVKVAVQLPARLATSEFVLTKAETLYHIDNALLYIAYVMLILAAPIPADRWHCSLWP